MIKLRAHAIGHIMTEPRSKAAKDAGELSETAKSYCLELAKQHVYNYEVELDKVKVLQKGLQVEQDSIDLFNIVTGSFCVKNTQRFSTDLLTGEPDIITEDCITDIKSAWSLATFPVLPDQAHSDLYEYQLRAYMHLADKPHATLAYCLVSTPEELCRYEDYRLHFVDEIPPEMRVTLVHYTRDMELEQKMLARAARAQAYTLELIEKIKAAHQH